MASSRSQRPQPGRFPAWKGRRRIVLLTFGILAGLGLASWFLGARELLAVELYGRAHALHRAGRDGEALSFYERAAFLGHARSRCFAAAVRDRILPSTEARATLVEEVEGLGSEPSCLALNARRLVWEGREAEALPLVRHAAGIDPRDAFVQTTLGLVLFRMKQYEEAAAAFERGLDLEEPLPADVFNAGYAHFLYGNYPAARVLLERSLKMPLANELAGRAGELMALIDGMEWACPMHPSLHGKPGNTCPECGMPFESLAAPETQEVD